MILKFLKIIALLLFFVFAVSKSAISEIVKDFKIIGNDRISKDTIFMFSDISLNDNLNPLKLNIILKNLYETNFFEDVSIKFEDNILEIKVKENPIIEAINFEGIKSNRINELIKKILH